MPYKCVKCSKIYEDTAQEVLKGCNSCQGRFFFYIKKEQLQEIMRNNEVEDLLTNEEKSQIEQDVREITGIKDEEQPVFLDFESVKIIKPGKYLLDLGKLFAKDKPHVYKLEDGKYIIDLALAFKKDK